MPATKQLEEILQESESIKLVTESLSEVSALKFKATKDFIEHTSFFYGEIAKVYQAVKLIATQKNLAEGIKVTKNNRTICLLLTSNSQFYGGLDVEISGQFVNQTKGLDVDRVVIGETGINYLISIKFNPPFTSVVFRRDMPSSIELNDLVTKLSNYSKILIFHSKFVTVLNQESEITDIGGENIVNQPQGLKIDYLLEPEIKEMVRFFETQIIVSLIQSIFLQSELARTAARMVSMDQAELNSEKLIENQKNNLLKLKKGLQNLRILETYNSMKSLRT